MRLTNCAFSLLTASFCFPLLATLLPLYYLVKVFVLLSSDTQLSYFSISAILAFPPNGISLLWFYVISFPFFPLSHTLPPTWKYSVALSRHGLRQRMSSTPKVAALKLFCAIMDLSNLSHKSLWHSYSYSQRHLWEVCLHWLIAMQRPFLAHSQLYPLLARARHPINSQQQCFWLRGSVAASSQYSLLPFFNLSTCAACPSLFSLFIKALLMSFCGSVLELGNILILYRNCDTRLDIVLDFGYSNVQSVVFSWF